MPVAAREIGNGSAGPGKTTVLTVTSAPVAGEIVLACGAATIGPAPFFTTTAITGTSDTQAGTWILQTGSQAPHPLIGNVQSVWRSGGHNFAMNIASAQRSGGTALAAGDTVTISWDPVPLPDPAESIGFLVALSGVQDRVAQQGGFSVYSNGDMNPENFNAPNVLDWPVDVGSLPHVDQDCAFVGLYGSYNGSAVVPALGARFTQLTGTHLYLAATFAPAVFSGTTADPSATFTGGLACVGNYQTIRLLVPPPPPGPTPKAACTKCGSGLMGLSYRTARP